MTDKYGFAQLALQIPEVLLPNPSVDLTKWSVVACDQYTSQADYWQDVKDYTTGEPSSLNIIFPEVYLAEKEPQMRIQNINQNMRDYLQDGVLNALDKPSFVLVDRKTSQVASRKGLVVSIDLEAYDFNKGSSSLIRATEGTIVDRLPPRIKVRQDADIEVPHIMVLIDDPEKTVIEPLFEQKLTPLYDFELMQKSGHVKGYCVDQDKTLQQIAQALQNLADPEHFSKKYQTNLDESVLLYAMGDGNHSLATAKSIWESIKQENKKKSDDYTAMMSNPARYALVELVNIHDEGLIFEPIHRLLMDIESEDFLTYLVQQKELSIELIRCQDQQQMKDQIAQENSDTKHIIPFNDPVGFGYIIIENPTFTLELASFEDLLSAYQQTHDAKVDFIHGDDVMTDLGAKKNCMGWFFPPISKHSLFKTIIFDGALPRKTFSMGEADEKRFYLEARKIK